MTQVSQYTLEQDLSNDVTSGHITVTCQDFIELSLCVNLYLNLPEGSKILDDSKSENKVHYE